MDRQGDAEEGICDGDFPGEIQAGWKCTKHSTQTDFRIGEIIDSWFFYSDTADQERVEKTKRAIEREELKKFEDMTSNE